ncbi:MAG: hypothetical protein AAFR64_12075 [Pseudomonadota bacterium]
MSLKWLACLACLAVAAAAFAQSADKWETRNTVHGRFPGIISTVETPIGDALETIDLGFLAALEARKGRLSLVGDFQSFDITADEDTSGPAGALIGGVEIESQILIFSGYATYAVVDTPTTRLDLAASPNRGTS